MDKQLQTESNHQDNHWLNTAEVIAVAGSIGGSIASIFFKEIILASAPLSACVVLNLMNRKRLLSLTTAEYNKAIAELTQKNKSDHNNLGNQIMQIQQSTKDKQAQYEIDYQNLTQKLKQLDGDSSKHYQELQEQCAELAIKTKSLSQIQSSSQSNSADSANSAESYCKNGNAYEQLGEKQRAIEEYSHAIKIDARCAIAHLNRGLLYSDAGNSKAAVEDLRKAAKFFFEQGDLKNYKKTKSMSQDLYKLGSDTNSQDPNQVLASSLFS